MENKLENTNNENSNFNVKYFKYFKKKAGWFLSSFLTLGFTTLSNKIKELNFICDNAIIDGYTIKFKGDKKEIAKQYKKWNLKAVLTFSYFRYFRDINVEKWLVENTVFIDKDGVEHKCSFTGIAKEWEKPHLKYSCTVFFTNGLFYPLASYNKCQYFVNHTFVDGKQLHYTRTKQDVFAQIKKDFLYQFITLAVYFVTIPHRTLTNNLTNITIDK